MATPTPLTRTEFDAGVLFFYSPEYKPYDYMDTYRKAEQGYILDKRDQFYCQVTAVDEHGFSCIRYLFGQPNEFKVPFKSCFKI